MATDLTLPTQPAGHEWRLKHQHGVVTVELWMKARHVQGEGWTFSGMSQMVDSRCFVAEAVADVGDATAFAMQAILEAREDLRSLNTQLRKASA